jgi:hypothetical protein
MGRQVKRWRITIASYEGWFCPDNIKAASFW